jgi:glycosyltransferase involved in cell wall biosynthesis
VCHGEPESAFLAEYGAGPGAPLTVVIAAYDEAGAVAGVVSAVPATVCDLPTEVIVVDDGSSDRTAELARAAGALVCRFPDNRGQGRALQAGYRLARQRGAEYIVTMDADGQFDAGDLPALVGPLLRGGADFVNGSRRLGHSQSEDRVRQAGVVAFGGLVSALTGVRITDPANGFRAFRSEVPQQVPLRQAQYQTAELLIGAIARGFKVVEAPVSVLPRAAGVSKKGHNVLYGTRFARVVITTWWQQMARTRLRRTLKRQLRRSPDRRPP